MELDKVVKFSDKITIEDRTVMAVYGEFNITTGYCTLYFNPTDINTIKNNKEEVQNQVEDFKNKLKENMTNEKFFYTI